IVMREAAKKLSADKAKDRALAAKLFNNHGWALLRLGRFEAAETSLRAARAAGNWRARLGLAEIARQRGVLKRLGRAGILEDVQ
ncbi:MAG: hypothetical protein ACREDN_09735, partial [Aestuariivirga sp.]